MRQVERHWIKEGHELYPICDDLTFKAKNLYNAGLYRIRQSIFERNKCQEEKPSVLSWFKLVSQFRKEKQGDMLALPSKVSTNILKSLGSTIHSYYQTLKSFHDESNLSVTNKPQLPRYLHKSEGRYVVEFTSQTIPCDKEFTLTVDTIPEMTYGDATTVLATHLTLIREGVLRTHRFTKDVPGFLGGIQLPLVGSTVDEHRALVDEMQLFPWGLRVGIDPTFGAGYPLYISTSCVELAREFTTF